MDMNRRNFLQSVPKLMCASGTAMFVAGKMLDQQKPVLHVEPKIEYWLWLHKKGEHVWYDIRETLIGLDGSVYQRNLGETCMIFYTQECPNFHRVTRVNICRVAGKDFTSNWA